MSFSLIAGHEQRGNNGKTETGIVRKTPPTFLNPYCMDLIFLRATNDLRFLLTLSTRIAPLSPSLGPKPTDLVLLRPARCLQAHPIYTLVCLYVPPADSCHPRIHDLVPLNIVDMELATSGHRCPTRPGRSGSPWTTSPIDVLCTSVCYKSRRSVTCHHLPGVGRQKPPHRRSPFCDCQRLILTLFSFICRSFMGAIGLSYFLSLSVFYVAKKVDQ